MQMRCWETIPMNTVGQTATFIIKMMDRDTQLALILLKACFRSKQMEALSQNDHFCRDTHKKKTSVGSFWSLRRDCERRKGNNTSLPSFWALSELIRFLVFIFIFFLSTELKFRLLTCQDKSEKYVYPSAFCGWLYAGLYKDVTVADLRSKALLIPSQSGLLLCAVQ